VGIAEAGRALLTERRRAPHDRLPELLATIPGEGTCSLRAHRIYVGNPISRKSYQLCRSRD